MKDKAEKAKNEQNINLDDFVNKFLDGAQEKSDETNGIILRDETPKEMPKEMPKKKLIEKLFPKLGKKKDKKVEEKCESVIVANSNVNSITTNIIVKPEIKAINPDHMLTAPPIVSFKNVTKKFGEKIAIKDVTFQIDDLPKSGEMISIVGPSGCGKSTILRILAGLTPQFPHTEGEVRVMGDLVTGYGSDRGLVDQKYSLLPHLTVAENIAFGLKLRGMGRRDRIEKAMLWVKKISLEGSEKKFPHELSGGMQQRVSLAATLILEPKILLMDEPFGALDPKTRLRMQELLIGLWKELQSTVLLVTHSMEEAVYLGDRIFRMEANPGRLVEILSVPRPEIAPEEMRKKPWFNDIVQELLHRIESGSAAKGKLKTKTYGNEDELELFKLMG
jgi:NitT/TauT family transport system ATP-binding protein